MTLLLALLMPFVAIQQDDPSDEKIKELVDQLGADYEEEREAAREKLSKIGAKAENPLIEALANADYRVRKICLDLLVDMKSTKACAKVAGLFRSKTEERTVQAIAFKYLKGCGKAAEDVMVEALDNTEESYRLGALEALIESKCVKCADKAALLCEKETNKTLKDKAFELLRGCGEAAKPHLVKHLASTDAGVRLASIQSLKGLSSSEDLLEPVTKMLKAETDPRIQDEGLEVLVAVGPKAEPFFIEGLKAASENVRKRSIEKLGKLKSEKALDTIGDLFQNDPNSDVRQNAYEYLVGLELKSESTFIKALDHKNEDIRLKAVEGLGAIKSEKIYDQIARLFREDKGKVHLMCFEKYILPMGMKAETELLLAMSDDGDITIRKRAIAALGYGQSLKAISPLIKMLDELSPEIRVAARNALVTIGPKAIEAVNASKDLKQASKDQVMGIYHQAEVDKLLDRLISENFYTGSFPGQFAELQKFGKERSLPVLHRIATEAEYEFRVPDPKRTETSYYRVYMRVLALMALGEMGGPEDLAKLQKLEVGEDEPSIFVEWNVARYKLGDKKMLEDFTARITKNLPALLTGEQRGDGYPQAGAAARMMARVGKLDEALKIYQEVIKAIEKGKDVENCRDPYRFTLYNLACLLSRKGEKAGAVETLVKAVDAGFTDLGWIQMDKDLDPIRDEESYKKLVADASKFKKGAD